MVRGNYGVGLWKVIRMEADLLTAHSAFSVGDWIWETFGVEELLCLCATFPTFYIVAAYKGVV